MGFESTCASSTKGQKYLSKPLINGDRSFKLLNMAEFVLTFLSLTIKLNNTFQEQLWSAYLHIRANLWMNWNEPFYKHRITNHFYGRHIDDIFFIWTHGEKRLQTFSEKLNKFHPNTKFIDKSHKEKDFASRS